MYSPWLRMREQMTTVLMHACVNARMGDDLMLGNSKMKLPDMNYAETC